MKVLFAGGGTLGSVTPLLAVVEALRARGIVGIGDVAWIGTKSGPERVLIEREGIPFASIIAAKFRRYFDFRNFIDPFLLIIGIVQAARIIVRVRPDRIVNAGSYIGVPVIIAGALLGKRCVIAQLDMRASLSNQIAAGFADQIAVANEQAGRAFSKKKTRVTGVPVRAAYHDPKKKQNAARALRRRLNISADLPILLVLGGGTGAQWINEFVWSLLPDLTALAHVILVTGQGKGSHSSRLMDHYTEAELLGEECMETIAGTDAVVTRAGMGTLAELAVLGKPTIIIPIPRSHQGDNAALFEREGAAIVCPQEHCGKERFLSFVRDILTDSDRRALLAKRITQVFPKDGAERLADVISAKT